MNRDRAAGAAAAPVTGERVLIVNADDLGLSAGVDEGILTAHREGIVTSASVMASAPGARQAVARALREAPELGLGLHVNLTHGRPLLPPQRVPSLVGADGRFVHVAWGIAHPERWRADEVSAEVEAQARRFLEIAGRAPDHVDAHQLVGTVSDPCRRAMVDVARRYGVPVRRMRTSLAGPVERWFDDRRSPGFLDGLRWPWRRGAPSRRTAVGADGLELRFYGERAGVETLLRILETLPEGVTELVCHPGAGGEDEDAYLHRAAELAALTDPRVRAKVRERGIRLATFGGLHAGAANAG